MIHIILRMCGETKTSTTRPVWFSRELCFQNLLATIDNTCSLAVLFDGNPSDHFVNNYDVDVFRFTGGSDAASFARALHYTRRQKDEWMDTDIVYFVEDDYIHRLGWPRVMAEAFAESQGDMVSLYDHTDRYKPGSGACKLTYTRSCHWRTAISTTNTFALSYKTLLEDIDVHQRFAEQGIQQGHHDKFIELFRVKNRRLVTCVPAYSTHCEHEHLAPCGDWQQVMKLSVFAAK